MRTNILFKLAKVFIAGFLCFLMTIALNQFSHTSSAQNINEKYVNVEISSKGLKEWSVSDSLNLELEVKLIDKTKKWKPKTITLILPYGPVKIFGQKENDDKNNIGSNTESDPDSIIIEKKSIEIQGEPPKSPAHMCSTEEINCYTDFKMVINMENDYLFPIDPRKLSIIQSKPSKIIAQVYLMEYKGIGINSDPNTFTSQPIEITVKPGWYSVYFGGLIGALLINILWFTFGLQNNSLTINYYKRNKGWRNFYLFPLIFLVRFINCAFVSLAVILLISSGQSIPLIAFSVKDFTGAIIIGLFSYPLGDWVSQKLLASQVLNTQVFNTKENHYSVNSAQSLHFDKETGLTIKLEDELTIIIPEKILRQSLKESEKDIKNTQDS